MTSYVSFTFSKEPRGSIYNALLGFAVPECTIALLVLRHSLTLSDSGKQILKELHPFLKVQTEASEWPGTRLVNPTATVFQYEFGPQCAEFLRRQVIAYMAGCNHTYRKTFAYCARKMILGW